MIIYLIKVCGPNSDWRAGGVLYLSSANKLTGKSKINSREIVMPPPITYGHGEAKLNLLQHSSLNLEVCIKLLSLISRLFMFYSTSAGAINNACQI